MFKTCKKPPMSIITASGNVCSFNGLQEGLPLKSHVVQLVATQSGSGTPSPDNVRTISGWSAINIGSDNKYADFITWNQLYTHASIPSDSVIANVTTYTINGITWEKNDDNSFTVYTEPTGATADSAVKIANAFDNIGNAIYSNYHIVGATGISGKARIYYSNRNIENTDYGCFNPLGSGFNMWLGVRAGEIITEPIRVYPQIYNISLMFGATKAQEIYSSGRGVIYFRGLFPLNHYEYNVGSISTVSAVNGSTNSFFTINLGGTYYFGEYDARTGVLTVTHGVVDLGSLTWERRSNADYYYFRNITNINNIKGGVAYQIGDIMCSIYEAVQSAFSADFVNYKMFLWTDGKIYLRNDDYTDANDFKTAMSGINLVYELATPQTIQLPPCPIDTLEGENNIWADTGNTSLEAIKIGR